MINKRAFSFLNIIIIVCVLILGGLAIKKYASKPVEKLAEQNVINEENKPAENNQDIVAPTKNEAPKNNAEKAPEKASALPDPSTLPTLTAKTFTSVPVVEPVVSSHNGHFENSKYAYAIDFPKDWILKDEQLDNVTIGKIPPSDGVGALNFRIGSGGVEGEISKLKQELKQYAGMVTLTEDTTSVAGETADRLILSNIINNTKNYYIIFSHGADTFVVKFPYQSEGFYQQVETVLKSFKFISK